jgi:putative Ca2+/H+ antiporter (TMEM165/GDT1 family)
MNGFLFTLLATFLAGIGARDQVTVAGLAARQGQRPGLLIVGIAVSFASAAAAVWAAKAIAPMVALPNARLFLAAMALGFAGSESLMFSPRKLPQEPTLSLGATAIVLLAHQLTDAARFLIFAIALATSAPLPAGIGGAAGGLAAVTLAWTFPEVLAHPRLRLVRRIVGGVLLVLALFLGFRALGKL